MQVRALWLRHGTTVTFGLSALLLVALGSWWFLYLSAAVRREADLQVALATCRGPADPALLAEIARAAERRQAMIQGEGSLLLVLLAAVLAMLWRLVRAERRFRLEMRDFLGRVTHEMKTPLAGIKAVLQTLSAGRLPPEQLPELATMALREVEREERLVQNLLLAQRLRLPEQQLAREPIELSALLAQFVALRQGLQTPLAFALDCPAGLTVQGDRTAIWTIWDNLADNAAKYGARRLSVRVQPGEQAVRIALADDGQGWAAQAQAGLFAPFVRAADAGLGTGLGLHLSRQLARRMGGELAGESAGVGQGATFTLTLPVA
jgi:signal transduction histidine kinase